MNFLVQKCDLKSTAIQATFVIHYLTKRICSGLNKSQLVNFVH